MPGRRSLRIGSILLALVLTACGQASGGRHSARPRPVRFPIAAVHRVDVVGGSAAQRRLLRRIVVAARVTQLRELRIAPADRTWHPARPGDAELLAVLRGPTGRARENLRGEWESWIVGGAFRDLSAAAGLPRVLAVGSVATGQSRVSPATTHLPSRPVSGAGAFRRRVLAILRASGARIAFVQVGVPDGYTVAAGLQTSRPVRFLQHRLPPLEAGLFGLGSDGWFLTVYGPHGNPIDTGGNGGRMTIGGGRVAPRYVSCVNGLDGHGGIAPPLPCPADRRPPASTPRTPLTVRGWEGAGKATVGDWDGPKGIAVPYDPGATGALGFALQNENGAAATVEAIHVAAGSGSAVIRYVGARIEVPASRSRPGDAGELHPPYGSAPPFAPVRIRPGDWVGVALHFAVARCTATTAGRTLTTDRTFTITYRLGGDTVTHTYTGVPLHVATPATC